LAYFFNKKHLKVIAVANVPAKFLMIIWFALIVFSITENTSDKLLEKLRLKTQVSQTLES